MSALTIIPILAPILIGSAGIAIIGAIRVLVVKALGKLQWSWPEVLLAVIGLVMFAWICLFIASKMAEIV